MLYVGGVGVSGVRCACVRERCEQPSGIDRIRESLEQLERSEAALQEPEPFAVGGEHPQRRWPPFGDLTQKLEPGSIGETLASHDQVEFILSQQIEAVCLGGHGIDREMPAQGARNRFKHRGVLIDDDDPHNVQVSRLSRCLPRTPGRCPRTEVSV